MTQLVAHPYFRADTTPIQLFNRATEPFLPAVKPHTFAVLEDLDARGLAGNHRRHGPGCGGRRAPP
ncbi:hypothetical protein [Frankia sp. CcWB3]